MKTVTVAESGVSAMYEVYTFGSGRPHITFTAGIHGDEVSGIYVARQLIAYFQSTPPLRGTVTVIPTVNCGAMRCMQRRNPFDQLDLNRIFPGDERGSLSYRLAASIFAETADADLLVDLHCCGQHGLPYILSIYNESEPARNLVSRITMPIAVQSEGTPGQLFTESCRRRDQAACIIELPSGAGKGTVNLPVAELCMSGLMDLLRTEGVVAGQIQGTPPRFYGPLKDAEAPGSGLWRPQVEKGAQLEQGQLIGHIENTPVYAPESGMVMSVFPCGYVFPDDRWVMTYVQPAAGAEAAIENG